MNFDTVDINYPAVIVGVDDPTQDIEIGMRVQVEFEEQESGDYPVPVFRPA